MTSPRQRDEDLLALLRLNAREPVASLARKLKLSRTTVQDRIKRLEEQGVIEGYSVRLASPVDKSGIRAYVTISVKARRLVEVGRALSKPAQIEALHRVAGKFDLVALARTPSAEDMDRMLDVVGLTRGVTRTESAIILSTKIDRR
jgi:DNA-binding Lrp family transcriptional regulator